MARLWARAAEETERKNWEAERRVEGSGRLSPINSAFGEPPVSVGKVPAGSRLIAFGNEQILRRVTLLAGFQSGIPAMNKDNIEGGVRKTAGQFEETAGRALKDKQTTGQGLYDQAAGAAQNAYGQAKDMVSQAEATTLARRRQTPRIK